MGDGWLRRNSNEKMRPMSRKTRIRCPFPQFVEWALVGSRSLLLDPLRSSLYELEQIRRECKSLAHSSGPPQSADVTLRRGRTDKLQTTTLRFCASLPIGTTGRHA